jgi:hypothetical protein
MSTESQNASTETADDEVDLLGGPAVGRRVCERLLLSLIDAHPSWPETASRKEVCAERERRLKAGLQEVFNEYSAITGEQAINDDYVLWWMAHQRYCDLVEQSSEKFKAPAAGGKKRKNKPSKLRSDRFLAKEAAQKFYGSESPFERLRKKWDKQGEWWLEMEKYHDYVVEAVETKILAEIWRCLRRARVTTIPNDIYGAPIAQPAEVSERPPGDAKTN